jgi:steroid C-25 hydroxylase alpha subunit
VNSDFADEEKLVDRWIADGAVAGNVPEGTTLQSLREDGHVRLTNWGLSPPGIAQASDLYPDQTHSPYRWHVEEKHPYPTLTRRAQFYIDHPWFIEAGEALPVHEENPPMGGDYPLELTSGHTAGASTPRTSPTPFCSRPTGAGRTSS